MNSLTVSTQYQVDESRREQLELLLWTPAGTVPLDRGFGVDYSLVDMPPQLAQAALAADIAAKIETYIPGLAFEQVRLTEGSADGNFTFEVVVSDGG